MNLILKFHTSFLAGTPACCLALAFSRLGSNTFPGHRDDIVVRQPVVCARVKAYNAGPRLPPKMIDYTPGARCDAPIPALLMNSLMLARAE